MEQLCVYVIDTTKYRLAREKLVGKGCGSCNNGNCKVPNYEKKAICDCVGWENSKLEKKAVVLENYNIQILQNIPDFDGEVITTEEMEERKIDLLKSESKVKKLI